MKKSILALATLPLFLLAACGDHVDQPPTDDPVIVEDPDAPPSNAQQDVDECPRRDGDPCF